MTQTKVTRGNGARIELEQIKALLKTGQVDYSEAKKMAKPHLEVMNEELEKIAKEFGGKTRKVTFTGFMR